MGDHDQSKTRAAWIGHSVFGDIEPTTDPPGADSPPAPDETVCAGAPACGRCDECRQANILRASRAARMIAHDATLHGEPTEGADGRAAAARAIESILHLCDRRGWRGVVHEALSLHAEHTGG
jgi:hypothetical protein